MWPLAATPAGAPDLSPEAVGRMLTAIGFTTGATREIEGHKIMVERVRVEARDKWLLIHILPKRMP